MHRKVLISQYFKLITKAWILFILLGFSCVVSVRAQSQKPSLPDPVKFVNKYDVVWNVAHAVLVDMGYTIELEDKKAGRITTKPYEFITGALTSSEVDKVAIKRDTVTGAWLKARYTVETLLEIVSPTETMVTVRTKMEALNRDVDGSQKWVPLESLGTFEKRILGKMSMKLLGNELPLNNKKGFWDKSPQPVDSRTPKPYPSLPPD